ncbi:hypothetical protein [Ensifer sp. 4252]
MRYDWTGVRGRRMKIARYGAAVTLAAVLFTVAVQVSNKGI